MVHSPNRTFVHDVLMSMYSHIILTHTHNEMKCMMSTDVMWGDIVGDVHD